MFRINLCLVFLLTVFQFLGCSSVQPNVSSDSTAEKNLTSVLTPSPTPEKSPKSIADENFEKEWKSKYEATSAELERNRQLWQKNKIVNYEFVILKAAGGVTNSWNWGPVLIKVREGKKKSLEAAEKENNSINEKPDAFEDFDTIDKLFNYLSQELEKGKMLYVKYNKSLGYPREIHIKDSYEIHGYRNIFVKKVEIIK